MDFVFPWNNNGNTLYIHAMNTKSDPKKAVNDKITGILYSLHLSEKRNKITIQDIALIANR